MGLDASTKGEDGAHASGLETKGETKGETDGAGTADDGEAGPEERGLEDPWNLARVAMGSLAGEPWHLRKALVEPSKAFELRRLPDGSTWWQQYQRTQTFDAFKSTTNCWPSSTNRTIDIVIVGDPASIRKQLILDLILVHVEAFIGFKVVLKDQAVRLGEWACPRLDPSGHEQAAAHLVLGRLQGAADPRSVCTVGLTCAELYPPRGSQPFVHGATAADHRVGVFSFARYFQEGPHVARDRLSNCLIKVLTRECLKLAGMRECCLLRCLMNPCARPEAAVGLPLSLCCICLRKLHWLTNVGLLDRYAHLPTVLCSWFANEARWLQERQVQVGMPTYTSLQTPGLARPDYTKF